MVIRIAQPEYTLRSIQMTHSISEANESATAPKMKGRQLVMMSLGLSLIHI